MSFTGRRIILDEIPSDALSEQHFHAEDATVSDPGEGELVCRVVLISIDPANRAWMQGPTYRDAVHAGDTMAGYSLGEVVAENGTGHAVGSVVLGDLGRAGPRPGQVGRGAAGRGRRPLDRARQSSHSFPLGRYLLVDGCTRVESCLR